MSSTNQLTRTGQQMKTAKSKQTGTQRSWFILACTGCALAVQFSTASDKTYRWSNLIVSRTTSWKSTPVTTKAQYLFHEWCCS